MKTRTLASISLCFLFPIISGAKDFPLTVRPGIAIDSSLLIAVVVSLYGIKLLLGIVRQTATRGR